MLTLPLNENVNIPVLGFGTWQITGSDATAAVKHALEVGYRHIDTADAYGNHEDIAPALKASGIPREELFITTKVWHDSLRSEDVIASAKRFLEELQTDYIDLLLIHWPNKKVPIQETLEAMEALKNKDLIRAIGVSNFTIKHLDEALKTGIEITNNQVEFHPTFNQKELKDYLDEKGIVLTAYSPLGRRSDLDHPILVNLAKKYDKPVAQVIINWLIGKNIIVIPKSANKERITENYEALKWELNPEDISAIDAIEKKNRLVHPSHAEFD